MANNQKKWNGSFRSGWFCRWRNCLIRVALLYLVLLICTETFSAVALVKAAEGDGRRYKSNGYGTAIAQAAQVIAKHLHGVPDTHYDPGLPSAVTQYWNSVCPEGSGCRQYWNQGNLQCVFLVTGAFALAGYPLPVAHNAIDFWADYAAREGFQKIPAAHGNMPKPGDIIVWDNSKIKGVGHVAIVVGVKHPSKRHDGRLDFAQANGPRPFGHAFLRPNGTVRTWPNYSVLGYIRTSFRETSIS